MPISSFDSIPGVTDNGDSDVTSDSDSMSKLMDIMGKRRPNQSAALIKEAISNLKTAAKMDNRVAPICNRAIECLIGPSGGDQNLDGGGSPYPAGGMTNISVRDS